MNRYKIIQCVVAYIAGRSRDEAVEVVVAEILGNATMPSSLPVMFAEYKFFTTEDVELYLSYLDQMPAHFEDLLLYEQQKAEAGLFMEDALAEEVIEQIESFLETATGTSRFADELRAARDREPAGDAPSARGHLRAL